MFVNLETAKKRYATCKICENFKHPIKTCGICNCFMPGKVILELATCPLNKWSKTTEVSKDLNYKIEDI